MMDRIKKELNDSMKKVSDGLKHQLTKIRTGRASPAILDGLMVDYYGTPSPLKQVGQVSTPEARLLQIQPFDKTMINAIEKAILGANLGVTPANDGNLIRIPFPALTEEKRKDQVKQIKKMGEDSKVAIRNSRRDQNEVVKKAEKAKTISEDDSKKFQADIQKITDEHIKEIDKIISNKEHELMTV
ncbi:MAG: ribosome recycling factor [Bdellovibrionales bacterium RIFOXYD12_FULL_39_22]|nr:MAG: ribosome recycling factor [Bdellovibrionales bacterium RIFOXYB1_FULL_39_21]OFZ41951.1 MAG: ribosome recycling factor [Bdellovibrionales bacterium RIFOXYC12_FULL_39_17]OFZ50667.1 MAG: ribosome recycling factor [Bdellovibrionales bacterium RIFOXYC1_FULL_39_130]OFZ76659.1 MAG: ribosome recycling factor [Bdellovibrionales bacterium RIFOXYC2_FULL_39_8]OFZ77890.1 MAG: ribosome recycling factor [Bdellovibrionales bacterium RIFOXYD1_FULL_39_84]OFZ93674.1 MAG: ribosome recycling factor [Bdellov